MENKLLSYPEVGWEHGTIPTGKRIAVDTETTGLDPYNGDKAFLFSFANEHGHVTVVPREMEYHQMLEDFFSDASITKIFHNAKFDIKMIRAAGFEVKGPIVDTIVMARLANENEVSYRLKYLCGKYFKYKALEDEKLDKWKKTNKHTGGYDDIPTEILYPYAAVDAWNCLQLFYMYAPEVKKFKDMYALDMKCLHLLIKMEDRGVLINKKLGRKLLTQLRIDITKMQKDLKEATDVKLEPDNKRLLGYAIWASGGEVLGRTESGQPLLDKKTLPKYVDTLPWMSDFIEFKKTSKVLRDLKEQIVAKVDDRCLLHTNFNLSQARTGRFSSSGPNLQNVGKKSCVREVFIPRPGYTLYYFDYSQVEYRLYAYLSGDETLIKGYVEGTTDMHSQTSEQLTIIRDEAKTVNFLILYGGGVSGLSSLLKKSKSEAKTMLQQFHANNPSLGELNERLAREWDDNGGHIVDPFGKHYHLDSSDLNKIVNTLIQGTACNVLKYAMLNCQELLKDTDAHMIQNIHDELIFEIPEKANHLIPLIKAEMEDIPQIKGMPLTVDVEYTTTNWAEKKEYPMEELKRWTMT